MGNKPKITIQFGGFPALLTLIFIMLKLTGSVDWSWFWVLFPAMFPFMLFGTIILFVVTVSTINYFTNIARTRK